MIVVMAPTYEISGSRSHNLQLSHACLLNYRILLSQCGCTPLLFLLLAKLSPAAGLSLLLLLLLQEQQSVDLVLDGVLRGDGVDDLLTANQSGHNASTDHKGQHKPVHAVPRGSVATRRSTGVVVVQEGERKELADQCVLNGEQQSWPGHGRCHNTGRIALVADLAAVAGPLETPVDGSEERKDLIMVPYVNSLLSIRVLNFNLSTYHSTVADLDRLEQVQQQLSGVTRKEKTVTGSGGPVDFVREVDGLERGSKVGDHTSHAEVHGLLGNSLKAEGVLDDFLNMVRVNLGSSMGT